MAIVLDRICASTVRRREQGLKNNRNTIVLQIRVAGKLEGVVISDVIRSAREPRDAVGNGFPSE